MRIGIALGFWIALAKGVAIAQGSLPGCAGEAYQDRLESITTGGELLLGSGRLARLSGLRLPEEPPHRPQALDRLKVWAGQPVLLTVQGSLDRWGRLPIRARSLKDSQAPDLARDLVEAGLAIVDSGADPVFCQSELLTLEAKARQQRLGLWADARYNPIPVDRTDRLKERVGSFVIVEGRVRSVGERKQRTYLNFGGHWAEDFTIIIPKKTWMLLAGRGLSADSLKGSTIRARGILQSWQGTALVIDLPEMIERLEGGRFQDKRGEDERLAR
jgi:endonuclease YncB( thermonuclease family)